MNHNNNQYGLSGFLKAIRSNDPLVLGQDLNKMGLDFTSKKKYLHKSFTGPWTQRNEPAVSVVDLSTEVPAEYKNVSLARNKLPELKMGNMGEDVLFYLFYNCPGDVYQIAAATELIKRSWRFHKVKKVWLLSPLPLDAQAASSSGDLGECLCYLFDPIRWRKETQTINLRADELEMSLHLSSAVNAQKSLPVASSRSQQPNIGNAAFTLSSASTSAYATNEAINSSAFAASEENPTLVRASTSASTTTPERSSQDDTMAANGSLSAVERALNQLKRIALGVSIPKQEIRFLLDFLNENPEVFGKMDSGNQFLNFIQYEPEVAGVLLVFQLMYDPSSYYSNLEILLNMHMNAQILIAVNKFVQLCEFKSLQVPSDFLNKFISLCISICERDSSQDMAADRLVRMVCVFFSALLGLRHFDPTMMRSEIQNFATSYLSLREASQLYQKTLLL